MKIFIKANPNSKKEFVEKISDTNFVVAVKEPPIKGKANQAIIKALADFIGIAPSRLKIISGAVSRQKIIEII
ncbi:MAG: DUF167 domain-containing protein [Patescibacteria group bacterium]